VAKVSGVPLTHCKEGADFIRKPNKVGKCRKLTLIRLKLNI